MALSASLGHTQLTLPELNSLNRRGCFSHVLCTKWKIGILKGIMCLYFENILRTEYRYMIKTSIRQLFFLPEGVMWSKNQGYSVVKSLFICYIPVTSFLDIVFGISLAHAQIVLFFSNQSYCLNENCLFP